MTTASEEERGVFSGYMTTVSHRGTSSEFTCDVLDALPFYSAAQAGGRGAFTDQRCVPLPVGVPENQIQVQ